MHRSTINQLIRDAQTLLAHYQISLPPFSHWTPDDWRSKGAEVAEIRDNALGWDITDFGSGNLPAVDCWSLLCAMAITSRRRATPNPMPRRF